MSRPVASTIERPGVATIWAAMWAGYIIWGALLYAWTIRRGDREGDGRTRTQWRSAAIVGTLLLLGGNGGVVWAEKTIPSGVAALLVALVPLWMALLDRLFFGGHLRARAIVGLVAGFGGAALLLGSGASGDVDLVGMLFVVGASLSWAIGSLWSRTAPLPKRPFVGIGMEMLVGGVALGVAGILAGELGQIDVSEFSRASLLGLLYLIV